MKERINIGGVMIDNLTIDEFLLECDELVAKRQPVYVITPNVDHVIKFQKDADFRRVYDQAALVVADGVPLLWAAKFLGTPLKEKISGSDILPLICREAAQKGFRLFFMGGRPQAAEIAAKKLGEKFLGLQIVGTYCPPFGFEKDDAENQKIIDLLDQSKPDILFVGLGAPKQEKWVNRFYTQYKVPLSIGVGVSFEFAAGMVNRAPLWMQNVGLEWFWRILMEPGRLWRRYLIDDMQFFPLIFKQKFSKKSIPPR